MTDNQDKAANLCREDKQDHDKEREATPATNKRAIAECVECRQAPCYWIQKKSCIKNVLKRLKCDTRSPNLKRKEIYQIMMEIIHQKPLGKGNRVPLPNCLVRAVFQDRPSARGIWVLAKSKNLQHIVSYSLLKKLKQVL